jgi:DNA replication and repair protein RecF
MLLTNLWLKDFRCYEDAEFVFDKGLTAIVGPNGIGKTNLIEALVYLSKLKSFRGAPTESLVRKGCTSAVLRAVGVRDDRDVLIELELGKGRNRVQVNRQRLSRTRDLLGALQVSVFSPDDLDLIKGGPSFRRDFLDDTIVSLDSPSDALFQKLERILKQRNALLKQIRSRTDESSSSTLEVWDKRLDEIARTILDQRLDLLAQLEPLVRESYKSLSDSSEEVRLRYSKSWEGESLYDELQEVQAADIRRAVTSLGPHRDELVITVNSLLARTEASQGEQRTAALALKLAAHKLVSSRLGEPPLLLLDDVLSELDPQRSTALLENLDHGQTIISTAAILPDVVTPDTLLNLG